ncbi:MAG: (2Fe-2S)-binding protein [Planctomycetes bacterium]|nr:(2Fe-2S)-binding protein [Planctomycetota bacterium]NOG55912.1 (2Fe-2S)-binding protein [Planctomycetota bacterium]
MHDDEAMVCLCFQVPQRKIANYLRRNDLKVASQLSECLGAGTGCGWCVPYLRKMFEQHQQGRLPALDMNAQEYAASRRQYREAKKNNGPTDSPDHERTG